METSKLCRFYFKLGIIYQDILIFLAANHGICISMRTLKRILRTEGLFRRKLYTDVLKVAQYIEEKSSSTGNQQGYRWMHLQCRQNGMNVSRDIVSIIIMQLLDPLGVELRLKRRLRRREYFSKGPDFLWHLDSYDKLKPYGLCINGCVDGFSRQVIWLNAYITSCDPRVIAGYYLEAVEVRHGCPSLMRGDLGTENGRVAQMQEFLTGKHSFIYGRSTANQRIEMFWNVLRKHCAQFWIDTLSDLKDRGGFSGSFIDKNLVQFCFLKLLQGDIDETAKVWNTHQIRPSKNQNCPHGRPLVMYSLPALYNTRSFLQRVDRNQLSVCKEECKFRDPFPCDRDVFNLCCIYMDENNWLPPTDIEGAKELFCNLRNMLLGDL